MPTTKQDQYLCTANCLISCVSEVYLLSRLPTNRTQTVDTTQIGSHSDTVTLTESHNHSSFPFISKCGTIARTPFVRVGLGRIQRRIHWARSGVRRLLVVNKLHCNIVMIGHVAFELLLPGT